MSLCCENGVPFLFGTQLELGSVIVATVTVCSFVICFHFYWYCLKMLCTYFVFSFGFVTSFIDLTRFLNPKTKATEVTVASSYPILHPSLLFSLNSTSQFVRLRPTEEKVFVSFCPCLSPTVCVDLYCLLCNCLAAKP